MNRTNKAVLYYLVAVFLIVGCKNQEKEGYPLTAYLPSGTFYATLNLEEVLDFVAQNAVLTPFKLPFSPEDLPLLTNRIVASGINSTKCLVSAAPQKGAVHALFEVEKYKEVKNSLADLAFYSDWKIEKLENQLRYEVPDIGISIFLSEDVLLISTTTVKINNDNKHKKGLDSLLINKSNFATFNGEDLKKLGWEEMQLDLFFESEFQAELHIKSSEENTLLGKENPRNFGKQMNNGFVIDWNIQNNEQWMGYLDKMSSYYGISINQISPYWNGFLSLQIGDTITIEEKAIAIEFDDDFQEVETVVTHKRNVPQFAMSIGFNDQEKMTEALQSSGILTQQKKDWFLLFSPPLKKAVCEKEKLLHFESTLTNFECEKAYVDDTIARHPMLRFLGSYGQIKIEESRPSDTSWKLHFSWTNPFDL